MKEKRVLKETSAAVLCFIVKLYIPIDLYSKYKTLYYHSNTSLYLYVYIFLLIYKQHFN